MNAKNNYNLITSIREVIKPHLESVSKAHDISHEIHDMLLRDYIIDSKEQLTRDPRQTLFDFNGYE